MALEVFKKYSEEDLLHIARYRNLPFAPNVKRKVLASDIAADVSVQGLLLLLQSLTKEILSALATHWKVEYPDYVGDNPSKKLMAKHLLSSTRKSGAKDFFSQSEDYLHQIVGELELEVSVEDKNLAVKAILDEADSWGVEHCLSAFSFDKLHDFAVNSGLKVYGRSRERLLEALMDRKNMEKPEKKPKRKQPKISKKKPKIVEGISSVDLNSWYNAKDLSDWLEQKGLPCRGSKRELIQRILAHLAGKDVTIQPKEPRKKKASTSEKGKSTKRKAVEMKATEESEEESPKKKSKTSDH